ncbi:MAG: hypothetical protein AAB568_00770 [Patescibacteria group bacterium]
MIETLPQSWYILYMITAKKTLLYCLFFVAIAAYFTYLQSAQVFADPDSFYHAKIA